MVILPLKFFQTIYHSIYTVRVKHQSFWSMYFRILFYLILGDRLMCHPTLCCWKIPSTSLCGVHPGRFCMNIWYATHVPKFCEQHPIDPGNYSGRDAVHRRYRPWYWNVNGSVFHSDQNNHTGPSPWVLTRFYSHSSFALLVLLGLQSFTGV